MGYIACPCRCILRNSPLDLMQPSGFLFRGWMLVGWLVGLLERGKKLASEVYIEQVKKLIHLELGYIAIKKPRKLNKK